MKYDFSERKIKKFKRVYNNRSMLFYYTFLSMKYIAILLAFVSLVIFLFNGDGELLAFLWMTAFGILITHASVFVNLEIDKNETDKDVEISDMNLLKTIDDEVISDYIRRRKLDKLKNKNR